MDTRAAVGRQAAMWMAAAMLVIGFVGGMVFGVIKSGSLPGGPSTASTEPPPRMYQALEDETIQNPHYFAEAADRLANAKAIVTYCDGENCDLSHDPALFLKEMGFENVRVLVNGWTVWHEAGLPTEGRN